MAEIARVLRPNGVIQLIEPYETFSLRLSGGDIRAVPHKRSPQLELVDTYLIKLPHLSHWSNTFSHDGMSKSWSIAPQLHSLVSSEEDLDGAPVFHDIQVKDVVLPVGPWSDGMYQI
jgi:hypothetical protein